MPHENQPKPGFELAALNVGTPVHPMGSPGMADFENALDEINALAEASAGFVWRLQDETGNATDFRGPLGDDVLVNLSVWADMPSLHTYVYRTVHATYLARRKEWFEMPKEAHMVLWWVPAGHRPTIEEAVARLQKLRADGPSPMAFTFKNAYDSTGVAETRGRLNAPT